MQRVCLLVEVVIPAHLEIVDTVTVILTGGVSADANAQYHAGRETVSRTCSIPAPLALPSGHSSIGSCTRVNEAHGASERFRAALEASAKRQHKSRRGVTDADGAMGCAESWGSVWKALIRVHSLMMLRVRR